MRKKQIVVISSILVLVLVIGGAFLLGRNVAKQPEHTEPVGEEAGFETITYQGEKYRYNTDLKTILFLGVDNRDEVALQQYAGRGGQSDTILLLILDTKEKKTKLLQISRDTMVDIDVYDMDGEKVAKEQAQLAIQYAYGDGGKKSCLLTKEKVSELLYGIPVQSYVSLNIDGIAAVTDAIGGIEVTFEEDATRIDPAFQKGASVRLTGAQAEKYVRYRETSETGSNEGRMDRQAHLLEALVTQLSALSEGQYESLFAAAKPYMVTDLSLGELEKLTSYEQDGAFERVPGTVQAGEQHDEFYVEEGKLYELLLKLFYKKA